MIQQQMHDNAYILSYHDLFKIWTLPSYPFKQLDTNCSLTDRFPTSWSVQRGHHFFLFKKTNRLSSKITFHRHLQRKASKGTSSSDPSSASAFACKSPGWSRASKQNNSEIAPFRNEIAVDQDRDRCEAGAHNYSSEKECRESQAYATAFPSLSHHSSHAESPPYYNKEIPQLNRWNGNTVDIVDESRCWCFVLPVFLSSLFSPSPNPSTNVTMTTTGQVLISRVIWVLFIILNQLILLLPLFYYTEKSKKRHSGLTTCGH
jgi:hypothetical protein